MTASKSRPDSGRIGHGGGGGSGDHQETQDGNSDNVDHAAGQCPWCMFEGATKVDEVHINKRGVLRAITPPDDFGDHRRRPVEQDGPVHSLDKHRRPVRVDVDPPEERSNVSAPRRCAARAIAMATDCSAPGLGQRRMAIWRMTKIDQGASAAMRIVAIVVVVDCALFVPLRFRWRVPTTQAAPLVEVRGRPETAGESASVDRRNESAQSCGKGIATVDASTVGRFGTLRMPMPQRRSLTESYEFHLSRATEEGLFFSSQHGPQATLLPLV